MISTKICLLCLSLAALTVSCNGSTTSSDAASPTSTPTETTTAESPASNPESSPSASPAPNANEENLISAEGIGEAQLGMTLGALKQALGETAEFTVESPFIVDFDAIAVRQAGEVQYYILYLAGQSFTDADVIQGLFTDNPKFRTAEKIGPGASLQEAEQAYGQATLSFNTQNESREYARFERQSANLSFSTGNGNTETAGVYASPTAEYNETQEFREGATIESVLVICLTEECAPSTPAN